MSRVKPKEPIHQKYGGTFDAMCRTARPYWQLNTLPTDEGSPIIVVELLAQDIRVAVRLLTQANAIRRFLSARLVVLVGPDPFWRDVIWSYYDADRLTDLAVAHGADEVINIGEWVQEEVDGRRSFSWLGGTFEVLPEAESSDKLYFEISDATHTRALRVPRITDEIRSSHDYRLLERRCLSYARIYDRMFGKRTAAFVTSHVDYHQWGYAVDACMRNRVPVVHVQSTGSLKAYTLFPETQVDGYTCRMNWAEQIGDFFERNIWPHRSVLSPLAELVAWRSKSNFGRPSWWRGGMTSLLSFRTQGERASVRRHAMLKLELDHSKPVVAVFNHAVSDALHSNYEIFDDLADWFQQTVDFAVNHDEVNWLLIDHPAQSYYDSTENFEHLAAKHAKVNHLRFFNSLEQSKNILWSLVDLAVTVRGSVSNEFPAFGVPAIQAGWSEWSHCGFTRRCDDRDQYWQTLAETINDLVDRKEVITPEEVQRARLWLWFYRSGGDIVTPLVPHWESSQSARLYMAINLAMTHTESDSDPAFVSTRRQWQRRDPFLTRIDLEVDDQTLANDIGVVAEMGVLESTLTKADIETPEQEGDL